MRLTTRSDASAPVLASCMIAAMITLFAISAWAQECPQTTLIRQFSKQGKIRSTIIAGPAEFANMPRWVPGDGPPPLSAEGAVKAASAAMSKAVADDTLRIVSIMLFSASCDELKGHWFYQLNFTSPRATNPFQSAQVVVVMLDGTVRGPLPQYDDTIDTAKTPPPKVEVPKTTLGFDPLVPPGLYEGESAPFWTAQPAYRLFTDGDYAQLDAELYRLRESDALLRDGQSHYGAVMRGLAEAIVGREDWIERIQTWRSRFPKSPHAVIIEAEAWTSYAWKARGGGFADNVSGKGMEIYRERLARARRVLEESKAFAVASAYWYTSMLGIATGEGWPLAKQRELFNEGIARHPRQAGIYVAMAFRMTPRWGGNMAMYREFTDLAVKRTEAFYGNSMYAWMYAQYAEVEHDRPFRELGIPWPQMKSGLEQLLAKYPGTWHLNRYAYFACQANDKAAFLSLLPRLTKESVREDVWFGSYSFENCKETFTKRT